MTILLGALVVVLVAIGGIAALVGLVLMATVVLHTYREAQKRRER
jgi:hypothetical protein